MGSTTPDGLYYPSDYNLPADVPNDTQQMQATVQAALNAHMDIAVTYSAISMSSGWKGGPYTMGVPGVQKTGKLVIAHGQWLRTSALTLTDNTYYGLGTIPSGYRPKYTAYVLVTAGALNSAGTYNVSGTHARVYTDGSLDFMAVYNGSMSIDHGLIISGCWFTP